MQKEELLQLALAQRESNSDYTLDELEYHPYSYFDKESGDISLASIALMTQYSKSDVSKMHHTVVSYSSEHGYMVWCGDPLIGGELAEDELEKRIAGAVEGLPEDVAANIGTQIRELWDVGTKSARCNNGFLQANLKKALLGDDLRAGAEVVCEHIKNMFAFVEMEQIAAELPRRLASYKKATSTTEDSPIAEMISDFGFQGESLFISGPGGHGKTHEVKDYAIRNGHGFVEVQGHGQIETIDLYGYVTVADDGSKGWMDGPVSQAARKATKGEKVILFIDEFTNIPMREAAGLKAAFEPYKGHYYFNTGRNVRGEDNILVQEQLVVPVENLHICAAANIGAGYASDDVDKALKQRFMWMYYEAPDSKVKKILTSICKAKNFTLAPVNALMAFKAQMENLAHRGEIEEPAVLRHLSRKILQLAKSEDAIAEVARKQALQFVAFDTNGKPIQEQLEYIEEVIAETLGSLS